MISSTCLGFRSWSHKHMVSTCLSPAGSYSKRNYANDGDDGKTPNHYDVLGISNRASSQEVKDAYIKMSKEHHPDRNPGDDDAFRRFLQISQANEVLSNPSLRKAYDKGSLGQSYSVADIELRKHRYKGDTFDEARKTFQEEFSSKHAMLDHYTRKSRTLSFQKSQAARRESDKSVRVGVGVGGVRSSANESIHASRSSRNSSSGGGLVIGFVLCLLTLYFVVR